MESEHEERLKHSLPGTNQAGKGARAPEPGAEETAPRSDDPHETLAHSLPGTNQAGKGPRVPE